MRMIETGIPHREIDVANLSLFDKSTVVSTLLSAEALTDAIHEAGYRGYEWHAMKLVRSAREVQNGWASQYVNDAVVSLHQSFRDQKTLTQIWKHPNKGLAASSFVLLPERIASLDELELLQAVLGKGLPIVMYPEKSGEKIETGRSFTEKTFQPKPEVMAQWGVRSVEDMIEEAYNRGYDGICADLLHMRAYPIDGIGLGPWQESLPALLPHTKEIHISAGRVDQNENPVDTQQELKDLLAGKGTSDLLGMLRMIRESGWDGRIVTEIPSSALHELRRSKQPFISLKDLIEDHRQIVRNVQDILG